MATHHWKWSEALGVWAWQESIMNAPIGFCRGERLLTLEAGADLYMICWRGSTVNDWHGHSFGVDLAAAIDWLKEATGAPCRCAWPELNGMKHPPHTCIPVYNDREEQR